MNKIKTFFFLTLAAMCAALPASPAAAALKGQDEISLQAGIMDFEGDSHIKTNLAFGGRMGHYFTDKFSAELLAFNCNPGTKKGVPDVNVMYPAVAASYHLRFGKFMPFVQAGLGFMMMDYEGADNSNDFAVHWGAGLKYFWKPALLLRADVDHIINTEIGDGTNNLLAVAGVSWLFGAAAEEVKAAKPAEAVKPAPPGDSDNDGVTDDKDACMGTPAGTRVDASGCPLPPADADKDGVTDDKDQCPGTPAGAKVDEKGCQLPVDSDGDGVTDDKDQCPGTPAGTKVGATGCPEAAGEVPADVWVLEGVKFEVGSDVIEPSSLNVLDGAADILLPRQSVRIEVQGHTDSTGDAQKNLQLSEQRATAVKAYLVSKGIDGGRLETKGYGSSVPVGDNATADGRAANRRIEFKVLSR